MKRTSFALLGLMLALPGCCCPDGGLCGAGRAPYAASTAGAPVESVDSFAKKEGISRQQAMGYLREGQTMAAKRSATSMDPTASLDKLPAKSRAYQGQPVEQTSYSDSTLR